MGKNVEIVLRKNHQQHIDKCGIMNSKDPEETPEEWFNKGVKLPTPEERLSFYMSGLNLPWIFHPFAWRGIGNAREDLGDNSGAEQAYERAADATIAVAEGGNGETKRLAKNAKENRNRETVPAREENVEYTDGVKITIGKCPKCGRYLTDEDIRDIVFRGVSHRHTAYICSKCDTIIGFSATHH